METCWSLEPPGPARVLWTRCPWWTNYQDISKSPFTKGALGGIFTVTLKTEKGITREVGGMFKEEREQGLFTWSMLGDIEAGRPNLGPLMHLSVYRLMQFTLRDILIRDFGVETADRIFYEAGKKAGEEFCQNLLAEEKDLNSFLAAIQHHLKELKIGIFRVESANFEEGSFVITVAEDLDCSGLPVCDEEICIYDEGFIAGLLQSYTGQDFEVKEVDCWGSGDRICRFTAKPKK